MAKDRDSIPPSVAFGRENEPAPPELKREMAELIKKACDEPEETEEVTLKRAELEFFICVTAVKKAMTDFIAAEAHVEELRSAQKIESKAGGLSLEDQDLLQNQIRDAREDVRQKEGVYQEEFRAFEASCKQLEHCAATCKQAGGILKRICKCFVDTDWPRRRHNRDLVVVVQRRMSEVGDRLVEAGHCIVN